MNFLRGVACVLLAVALVECTEERETKWHVVGVSHISIQVSNLSSSTYFYTEILGGKLVDELSCLEGTSDMEYIRLWTREAAEQIVEDCAVEEVDCDKISPVSTSWKVYFASVLFDNMMIQLVQYESIGQDIEENVTPKSLIQDMAETKIAFWLEDSVNLTEYAENIEERSQNYGLEKVRFMRPLLLSDNANFREANKGVRELRDEKLKGLSIGYAKGPDGENIKVIQLVESSKHSFGKHYCEAKMISSALLNTDRCEHSHHGNQSRLNGVNHISIMTADVNSTLEFFINKMGAYFIDDVQPSHLQSPSLSKIMVDKLLAHSTNGEEVTLEDDDFRSKLLQMVSSVELNMRYILLGNIMVEVVFLTGLPPNSGDNFKMFDIMPGSSFSLPGSTEVAFMFSKKRDLENFAAENGGLVQPSTITKGPLQGLTSALMTSPSKRTIRLVHFSHSSKHHLHSSMRRHGAVHPAFDGLNPWLSEGYYDFCQQFETLGESSEVE
ncbi:hypothetical protein EB796_010075 [Bugula neritina]|uniref:VOC domain-containing protein n=1 Tax=Bugula neritina TaxID=10212 RepID=A0A7J7K094_BUGNE|nr:hypothetical protein EB796_010075 [Bugula neritina]